MGCIDVFSVGLEWISNQVFGFISILFGAYFGSCMGRFMRLREHGGVTYLE